MDVDGRSKMEHKTSNPIFIAHGLNREMQQKCEAINMKRKAERKGSALAVQGGNMTSRLDSDRTSSLYHHPNNRFAIAKY
jgi:hypothetical protein